mmetsp:Transcript_15373/g.40645  ORF Transcript_15373/g.40645 Transcript_15373/m.40645 type:complete len:234 (+) Transcript_15373:107-808(+)
MVFCTAAICCSLREPHAAWTLCAGICSWTCRRIAHIRSDVGRSTRLSSVSAPVSLPASKIWAKMLSTAGSLSNSLPTMAGWPCSMRSQSWRCTTRASISSSFSGSWPSHRAKSCACSASASTWVAIAPRAETQFSVQRTFSSSRASGLWTRPNSVGTAWPTIGRRLSGEVRATWMMPYAHACRSHASSPPRSRSRTGRKLPKYFCAPGPPNSIMSSKRQMALCRSVAGWFAAM